MSFFLDAVFLVGDGLELKKLWNKTRNDIMKRLVLLHGFRENIFIIQVILADLRY